MCERVKKFNDDAIAVNAKFEPMFDKKNAITAQKINARIIKSVHSYIGHINEIMPDGHDPKMDEG